MENLFARFSIDISGINNLEFLDTANLTAIIGSVLSSVVKALGNAAFAILLFVFMLLEATNFPSKLKPGFEVNDPRFARLIDFNNDIREYAQNADLIIHECFITVDLLMKKFGFSRENAINVGTKVHTSPEARGMVLEETQPRHAIVYHFFHDIESAPAVQKAIRSTYDGSLTLAKDLMVCNVTPEEITTR